MPHLKRLPDRLFMNPSCEGADSIPALIIPTPLRASPVTRQSLVEEACDTLFWKGSDWPKGLWLLTHCRFGVPVGKERGIRCALEQGQTNKCGKTSLLCLSFAVWRGAVKRVCFYQYFVVQLRVCPQCEEVRCREDAVLVRVCQQSFSVRHRAPSSFLNCQIAPDLSGLPTNLVLLEKTNPLYFFIGVLAFYVGIEEGVYA